MFEAGHLLERLTRETTDDWEENKASRIHNPTICCLWKIMAHINFGRDNAGNVNSKELCFLHCIFSALRVHSVTFIMTHIRYVSTATRCGISIGELSTSNAHAFNLEVELATLVPITGSTAVDIHACRSHKLVKYERDMTYFLQFKNKLVSNIVLTFPQHINIQNQANWLFDLSTPVDTSPSCNTLNPETYE